jgi:hypothetical protein
MIIIFCINIKTHHFDECKGCHNHMHCQQIFDFCLFRLHINFGDEMQFNKTSPCYIKCY